MRNILSIVGYNISHVLLKEIVKLGNKYNLLFRDTISYATVEVIMTIDNYAFI